MISNITRGNVTMVLCNSTHLTSFAVLVDVAGGLEVGRIRSRVVYLNSHTALFCRTLQEKRHWHYRSSPTLVASYLPSVSPSLLSST